MRPYNKLGNMPRMIQIRHVPDAVHRRLKAQAATEGLSLSGYVLRELERFASHPTLAELEKAARQTIACASPYFGSGCGQGGARPPMIVGNTSATVVVL